MQFPLNVDKMIQAAAALLRTEHSREMPYLRLLKLLYIADRESLKETGRPIVGGRQVAMDFGPVPSRPYDAIKGCDASLRQWCDFIERDGYKVRLVNDPGVDKLTKYEAASLVKTAQQYADCDEWELVEQTHKFAEYAEHKPPEGSSQLIPWEDIAKAVGLADKIASMERYQREREEAASALSGS